MYTLTEFIKCHENSKTKMVETTFTTIERALEWIATTIEGKFYGYEYHLTDENNTVILRGNFKMF